MSQRKDISTIYHLKRLRQETINSGREGLKRLKGRKNERVDSAEGHEPVLFT
jgi:hypothetical protein